MEIDEPHLDPRPSAITSVHFPSARSLLPQCLVGGIIVAGIGVVVLGTANATKYQWLLFALFYIGGGAVLALRVWLAHLDTHKLFGPAPSSTTLRLIVVAVPLMMFSAAGFWLLFLPLSYVVPGFVRAWGLANANLNPVQTLPAWVMQVIVAVILAPIAEELLFRGLLLQRWATKWGTSTAVIVSSALFALGHVELFGHFVFGVVMCALYLRTRSLWVPIATHALNNAIVSVGTLASVIRPDPASDVMTIQSLRSEWWIAALLLVAGVVVLEWYRRKLWSGIDIRALLSGPIPYLRDLEPEAVTQSP